jgi:hypothetical protein
VDGDGDGESRSPTKLFRVGVAVAVAVNDQVNVNVNVNVHGPPNYLIPIALRTRSIVRRAITRARSAPAAKIASIRAGSLRSST